MQLVCLDGNTGADMGFVVFGRNEMDAVLPNSNAWTWKLLDLKTEAAVAQAKSIASDLCLQDERASLDHNLFWLLDGGVDLESVLQIYVYTDGYSVIGYAPLRLRKTRVSLFLAHLCLFSIKVDRLSLIGSPLFKSGPEVKEEDLTRSLLTTIARALAPSGVFLAYGARSDSALFNLLNLEAPRPEGCRIIRHGKLYQRRLIRQPETFDAYMAALGRKTRENLRRRHRQLLTAADSAITLKRYTAPSEVRPFLDAAISVSRTTYQWHLHDSGLKDRNALEHRLNVAAVHDWLCCYALFDGDDPIAFMMGCRYGDTYYSQEIGYKPKWAGYSVGNVLHCLVVNDLIDNFKNIKYFDFLFGDNSHKRALSNETRIEGNFYAMPNTLRGLVAYGLIFLDNRISALSASLENSWLKTQVRKMLRQRAIRRGDHDRGTRQSDPSTGSRGGLPWGGQAEIER